LLRDNFTRLLVLIYVQVYFILIFLFIFLRVEFTCQFYLVQLLNKVNADPHIFV